MTTTTWFGHTYSHNISPQRGQGFIARESFRTKEIPNLLDKADYG